MVQFQLERSKMDNKYCLCCGKPIENNELWHKSCIKSFFGVTTLPDLSIAEDDLKSLAILQLQNKNAVQGVQEKLSLHLDLNVKKRPRLTIIGYPSGYILKPQSSTYKQLPEFEHTAMLLAEACDIKVVPHGLIPISSDNELAYITKRIDRDGNHKIHMEDFAQATNTLTEDKYRSSYEECMELIDKHAKEAFFNKTQLFAFLYFCFVIGNSDVHLKNFSFIMNEDGSLSLSKFYDLLPTKVILPSDKDDLGMRFNGKKNNLTRRDFDAFAKQVGIEEQQKNSIIRGIDSKVNVMEEIINNSLLNQNARTSWIRLIKKNIRRFNNN